MAPSPRHRHDAPPPEILRKAAPLHSRQTPATLRIAWLANTLCAVLYLAWLVGGRRESLFYDRDAVLFLLPVVPIVAVYLYLARVTFPDRPRHTTGRSANNAGRTLGRSALSDWLRRPPRRR